MNLEELADDRNQKQQQFEGALEELEIHYQILLLAIATCGIRTGSP